MEPTRMVRKLSLIGTGTIIDNKSKWSKIKKRQRQTSWRGREGRAKLTVLNSCCFGKKKKKKKKKAHHHANMLLNILNYWTLNPNPIEDVKFNFSKFRVYNSNNLKL